MPGTELFGPEEKREVNDVLETGILFRYGHASERQNICKSQDFESEVKRFTGAKFSHAVSSGSAAILAALSASGVGYNDEVIVPPFTFIATIEAVLMLGAIPVFAEIDETLCLSAKGIQDAITERTKAVCLVHMCGIAADMDPILEVIQNNNLILIEDAGQAYGATYKGTFTGLFGKAGAYSFDFFKIATAAEGGVAVTNDEETYKLIDTFTDHGHTHIGKVRGMEDHPILGFNFRISELHSAIGLVQARRVPEIIKLNKRNKSILQEILSDIKGINFSHVPDKDGDTATFLNILCPDKEFAQKVNKELGKTSIGGYNYWFENKYHFISNWEHLKNLKFPSTMAINKQDIPQDYNNLPLNDSTNIMSRLISFGIRCAISEDNVKKLGEDIAKVFNNI